MNHKSIQTVVSLVIGIVLTITGAVTIDQWAGFEFPATMIPRIIAIVAGALGVTLGLLLAGHFRSVNGLYKAVIAVILFIAAISSVVLYQHNFTIRTVPFDTTRVVRGTELLNSEVEKKWEKLEQGELALNPGYSIPQQLVFDAGGQAERVWTPDSISSSLMILSVLASVMLLLAVIVVTLCARIIPVGGSAGKTAGAPEDAAPIALDQELQADDAVQSGGDQEPQPGDGSG
ncbi:MAG: hypothetical protein ED559_11850 [Phycisphaera sp.]|nr:MAG: hypothetical protein ED559_11850 [Phycisphaera sp.]